MSESGGWEALCLQEDETEVREVRKNNWSSI